MLSIDERIKCKDMDLIKYVQDKFVETKDFPDFGAGDTITVYYQIREGEKTRTQFFRGDVLQRSGSGTTETFTIRKMSGNIGVERIFPVNMPNLEKIEITSAVKFAVHVYSINVSAQVNLHASRNAADKSKGFEVPLLAIKYKEALLGLFFFAHTSGFRSLLQDKEDGTPIHRPPLYLGIVSNRLRVSVAACRHPASRNTLICQKVHNSASTAI